MTALMDPNTLTHAAIDAMQSGREMETWIATMLLATSMPSYHAVDMTGFAGCSTDPAAAQRLMERLVERGWDYQHTVRHWGPDEGIVAHEAQLMHSQPNGDGKFVAGKYCREHTYALTMCRSALHALLRQRLARAGS